ncbi:MULTISPECIES: phosphate regulon transcriptional regulator PhoB [Methylococcus]|jgi:two-component system phosphate regulon response regulator PhoB|uniref:Phosphate regulon transcriptional regulatory protein PhoB n=2 Tax=Methylococcus capsulatus TaxID=414 RepID=Q602F8_METCA|nr:phosphate regulon transcriptional regulator PhoB [Methylococcus capsulatus]AAU90779.1 DNA-binding response regulator PhoB [Methylococcus capsulatus str. Bath]QXP86498.1 phosphate regulon transcriptional regulator PhoB [Methylococcus capsulatus]QXP89284.1 phosphate regulon transcriptional regulator PhoB [Methylococcus capsulatus]QXP93834.1 phosphate regulon transcriptional regulator PhoB [Methylococcus capsulatus]UQN11445.1 phosphate regulon transcriptional regulator PhoB [Methylococcus caps
MSDINVLVVEDEEAIREMLTLVLEQADFAVQTAGDVQQALNRMDEQEPDLILLDWMLPGVSGVEWARRLKKDENYGDIPLILVTARGEEEDKIRGLDVGADDYVTKPFSPRELIARIRAVLRRSNRQSKLDGRIEIGGILLDTDEHRLSIDDESVNLSPTEYRLMEFFLTHPSKVYSRAQLLDQVWGRSAYIEERTVDVHIRRLRKILSEHDREDMIQTVRGFGYRFSTRPD